MARIIFLSFIVLFVTAGVTPQAQAQTANVPQAAEDEQNETFRDTLVRMRIKREEEEHKKVVAKAEQIKNHTAELLKYAPKAILPREADKRLKEIEKNARNIRSDAGGGEDTPLDEPPANLDETLKRLEETSDHLNKLLGKTSRHVVSITVSAAATEIIQLTKLLRTYLR